MEELIVAFKEEILGGAEGLIDAITKFSGWIGIKNTKLGCRVLVMHLYAVLPG